MKREKERDEIQAVSRQVPDADDMEGEDDDQCEEWERWDK